VLYGDAAGVLHGAKLSVSAPSFAAGGASGVVSGVDLSVTAPLVGRGGYVYVRGTDGVVRAFDSVFVEQWHWTPSTAPSAISQLNLDYNRDVANPCAVGEPGVLYFAATSGTTTKLYALLVDSAGLEPQAAWPRYQHNPANTGNAATGLSSWTCP
jgi:hypothetical protein